MTSPFFKVMGISKGITSSRAAILERLYAIGWYLSVSCTFVDEMNRSAQMKQITKSYLDSRDRIFQSIQVIDSKGTFPPLNDSSSGSKDFAPHLVLVVRVFGQLPEHP